MKIKKQILINISFIFMIFAFVTNIGQAASNQDQTYVKGYLSEGTNVRDITSGQVTGYLNKYTYVEGIKSGDYINLNTNSSDRIYDFGLLSGQKIQGYVTKTTYIRSASNGQVVGTVQPGEFVQGTKLSDGHIRLNSSIYVYDFGLLQGTKVSGYLVRSTNVRTSPNGSLVDVYKENRYVEGVLQGDYIALFNGNYIYNFGLNQGQAVSGYLSRNTNVRNANGTYQYTMVAGSFVEGNLVGDTIMLSNGLNVYNFGLLSGENVEGYATRLTNIRAGMNGRVVDQADPGDFIKGIRLSNGYIKLPNNLYVYDFGLLQGVKVSGYIPKATNVRTSPDGQVVDAYHQYKYIEGVDQGSYIGLFNGNYIYDFGLLQGQSVSGYIPQDVYARTSPNGSITSVYRYGDFISGTKVGNYIVVNKDTYVYDFGLLTNDDIVNGPFQGILSQTTNVRDAINGKLVEVYPAGTFVEGSRLEDWIALDNGYYIYNFNMQPVSRDDAANDIGIIKQIPSQKSVREYYFNYQSQASQTMLVDGLPLQNPQDDSAYAVRPNRNTFEPGRLTLATQRDSIHLINAYRYASALNEVSLNAEYSRIAQAGSFINLLNGVLTHTPDVPQGLTADSQLYIDGYKGASSSNIASGYYTIRDIKGYMADDDIYNKDRVGHRGWLLNNRADSFGIGGAFYHSAVYILGQNNNYDSYVTPWPNRSTAEEWVNNYTPHSVFFSSDFNISNANVSIKNLQTGKIRNYNSSSMNILSPYGSGASRALVFGDVGDKTPGVKHRITISGVTKNGQVYPIEYTVAFFNLVR